MDMMLLSDFWKDILQHLFGSNLDKRLSSRTTIATVVRLPFDMVTIMDYGRDVKLTAHLPTRQNTKYEFL